MAVYTHLSAEKLGELIHAYDVGDLISAKGIAEGVSNSNWLIETTRDRYILTMYETRLDLKDLPYFLGLLDHLAAKGSPVPRTIHDREGAAYRMLDGKAVALIEFMSGVSIGTPEPQQARAVGAALAGLHKDSADFEPSRDNTMGLSAWRELLEDCGRQGLASIDPTLPDLVSEKLSFLDDNWPRQLPQSVIHADLFPDNVLMRGNEVSGLIDFYFACNDTTVYDLAVTHAAWCFDDDDQFQPDIAAALLEGYSSQRPLSAAEYDALPVLGQGAAMRFLSTRAYDWLNTPADAMVTRKDPMAFARRLNFYAETGSAAFPGCKVQS
ncbi:homoserine kinase [Altericroceibacterium endophyticum]|uniref:Homoserine kinase n=1 Tax=Altericroceibacterium endophyticum TaxID=1808508 RepID=A0A6I4T8Q4_9SPHN|nr:homoserine kinase [Altericroceibacterium endophyticum]MXO66501.1 homoserine kinase [Altericroceibacterium endophyticum]